MALMWLNSIECPFGRITMWALGLQQYDFEIAYRKGQLDSHYQRCNKGGNGANGFWMLQPDQRHERKDTKLIAGHHVLNAISS